MFHPTTRSSTGRLADGTARPADCWGPTGLSTRRGPVAFATLAVHWVMAVVCLAVALPPAVAQQPANPTRPAATSPASESRRQPDPAARPAGGQTAAAATDDDDFEKKAALLQSSRWRRAVFELGEWLSGQVIYSPQQVTKMKADFNRRVATMSAAELEDLLDDLELKFQVMETPEAKDARAWVGQYLSAMSDNRRQQALRDVPDVVAMSAGQLATEIKRIEQQRDAVRRRQEDFDQSRQALVASAQANRQATSTAIAAGEARASSSAAYSPYRRANNDGKLPFSNVNPYGGGLGWGLGWGGGLFFGAF
jgi:hypothetical protein